MKKCGKCKLNKNKNDFSESQFKRSGGRCRICCNKTTKEYKNRNSDKIKKYQQEYDKKYYYDNKNEILISKKKYYKENKDKILENRSEHYKNNKIEKQKYNKAYYVHNKDQILENVTAYASKNQDKIKKYHNKWYKNRRNNNVNFKLKTNISAGINFYLKSNNLSKDKKSTIKYLPYTIQELKNHLESKFESWMTWNNYGKYDSKKWDDNDQLTWTWQIDHIIPHSTFKYNSMEDEEFKKCWSLNNLRPYSSKQNFLDGINKTRH